jgi:hypothetical protein
MLEKPDAIEKKMWWRFLAVRVNSETRTNRRALQTFRYDLQGGNCCGRSHVSSDQLPPASRLLGLGIFRSFRLYAAVNLFSQNTPLWGMVKSLKWL